LTFVDPPQAVEQYFLGSTIDRAGIFGRQRLGAQLSVRRSEHRAQRCLSDEVAVLRVHERAIAQNDRATASADHLQYQRSPAELVELKHVDQAEPVDAAAISTRAIARVLDRLHQLRRR